ncbi:MAG: SusC/RagA family TonB-linked outer membrane protein [Prolixibacteraceae bacterium]|nr:SusC/RagA family TonB-linked outer membrane protein [Prolixibacteraceae bacterium]
MCRLLVLYPLGSYAQGQSITGQVKSELGELLPGATILEKGTSNGTVTDVDGNFSLKLTSDDATLIVSFIGYETQEVQISGKSVLEIILSRDITQIDEVVAIGYGKQSRATMTSSVSTLKTDAIENIVYSNATQALQGRVSGLKVINTSGQPGSSPQIVLRGGSSISGNNSPLYIVDGVERAEINALRSDNIESLQVLKDATSTAVYGARGSNGVIIITTKSGKLGQSSINYKYRIGLSTFRDENFRPISSGEDYIGIARRGQVNNALLNNSVVTGYNGDARAAALGGLDNSNSYGTGNNLSNSTLFTTMFLNDDNNYLLSEGWSQMIDPITGETIIFKDTDWYDVNYNTGIRQEHNVDFSGADEKNSYYLSLGALMDEGILVNTQYDVYSMVFNADRKILDNLRVFGKLNFSHEMKDQPSGFSSTDFSSGAHLRNMILRSPNMAPSTKFTFDDGSYSPGVNQMMSNPLYVDQHLVRDQRKTRWTAVFGLDWDITEDLNFSPKGSVYHVETLENSSNDAYLNGTSLNTNRHKRTITAINWIKQFDGVLTYNKTLAEKHNVTATAVSSYRSKDYFASNSATQGSPTILSKH